MIWLTASVIDSDENVTNYIYIGIVFTVLSILAVTYLTTIFLSGFFFSLDRLWPPFIDDANDEKEFEDIQVEKLFLYAVHGEKNLSMES